MPAPQEFLDLAAIARGYQRSRALTMAAQLGIADLLRDGARSVQELAQSTGTQPQPLYRVLRALASIGVFREEEGQRFALSPMGEYLRSDHPLSFSPVARFFGADHEWKAWGELMHSLRTGETAAVQALRMNVWDYQRSHPAEREAFNGAMRTFVRGEAPALLAAHDFSRYRTIADIGGGTGANLACILSGCAGSRGILFDQPEVVANAAPVLGEAGVADRVEIVGGSFFESVPGGADAYLLRRILHDWMDPEAGAILRCIRRSMPAEARVLVIDGVVGPPNEDPLTKFLDLMMLVYAGGRERTEAEWSALLAGSGFRLERWTRVTPNLCVIEGVPA